MAKNPVRITTVEAQPIDVTLTTLRLEGHKLTRALYDQIPNALPFSTDTWTLDSQLLGWVHLYPKAPSRFWCLLFVRNHTLYHCQLPQTITEFDPYRHLRIHLRDSRHRLDNLLWGVAATHCLVHPPAPIVQANIPSSEIAITLHSSSYRLQLNQDDPLWALIQAPTASDAARLRWKLPGLARLYTQWPDSDSTQSPPLFRADPQFTRSLGQFLDKLQALWSNWSRLDPEAPDALFWSQLGVPSEWVAHGHSPLRYDLIDTWGPTAPWLNHTVYEQAFQQLFQSRKTLSETATKIETLWADLADRIASLPQIYLGL